jgi:hypothetical protein
MPSHFSNSAKSPLPRRDFLKLAAATSLCGLAPGASAQASRRVVLLLDTANPIASSDPVRRAAERLRQALKATHFDCDFISSADQAGHSALCVVVAAPDSALAASFPPLRTALTNPEALHLASGRIGGVAAVLVSAAGALGFIYALLEFAERVQFGADPLRDLHIPMPVAETPANPIRCVSRYFCSEIEDKSWYWDKSFWPGYLDTLVAGRFNRFCLGLGLAYDFPRGVTDDYLHLLYPYLVDVPSYSGVRVMQLRSTDGATLAAPVPLSAEERRRNFEALQFIAAETAARGLHFQLGIWTHAYAWTASPNAWHSIEGLTPQTHATYCRDALAILLKECPQIQGLTLRVHGESGIPEGSYPFWKTLFEAITASGRTIEIDMHAKGVDQKMIDIAASTGMPIKLGAKFSAEHQSLGYQQEDIRALEVPSPSRHDNTGLFNLSSGSRLFTRYSYADFLRAGSRAQVLFRLWPGTQRHLLSADPEMASAYGRAAHFCGATGIDLMEPLTFKGREGSGHAGGRCAYADATLNPTYDWQKFEYYYRVWGRKLYDPEAPLEVTRRTLRSSCGAAAGSMETAVASSSRILALLTSAHLTSASNHAFWPELYTNMPIVLGSEPSPYSDTPEPKCFATVSPLDPQLFSTITEHADDLLAGRANPKYSPEEVAQWLESLAATAGKQLDRARAQSPSAGSPDLRRAEFRRMEEDTLILSGLGGFFAAKLRSALLYAVFERTSDRRAGQAALEQYRKARGLWAAMAARAARVYVSDVSYGSIPMRRGHWSDRLGAIDTDLSAMEHAVNERNGGDSNGSEKTGLSASIADDILQPFTRPQAACTHDAPAAFHPGAALSLSLGISDAHPAVTSARLYYRHVNQGERWLSLEMQRGSSRYTAAIPADYTQTPFGLEYYFALTHAENAASLYPAFNAMLSNQPYYAVCKRDA